MGTLYRAGRCLNEDLQDDQRAYAALMNVKTKRARDEARKKRQDYNLIRAFRQYEQWCTERNFPLRETEFGKKYPAAYSIFRKGRLSWPQYVEMMLRSDTTRVRLD